MVGNGRVAERVIQRCGLDTLDKKTDAEMQNTDKNER